MTAMQKGAQETLRLLGLTASNEEESNFKTAAATEKRNLIKKFLLAGYRDQTRETNQSCQRTNRPLWQQMMLSFVNQVAPKTGASKTSTP